MPSSPRFLGIDPGTKRLGFGVVEKVSGALRLVDAGIVEVHGTSQAEVLHEISKGLAELITRHRPTAAAIEKLYFSKNQRTALGVAEARGVALLALRTAGLPFTEFTPNEVKLGVTGYGSADKAAVQKMVRLVLKEPMLKVVDDASDALALAILAAGRVNYPQAGN